jgi:N-methylhydantoinase B
VGGGGGYGDTTDRARAAIEQDIDDGLISPEAAHRDYPAIAAE